MLISSVRFPCFLEARTLNLPLPLPLTQPSLSVTTKGCTSPRTHTHTHLEDPPPETTFGGGKVEVSCGLNGLKECAADLQESVAQTHMRRGEESSRGGMHAGYGRQGLRQHVCLVLMETFRSGGSPESC